MIGPAVLAVGPHQLAPQDVGERQLERGPGLLPRPDRRVGHRHGLLVTPPLLQAPGLHAQQDVAEQHVVHLLGRDDERLDVGQGVGSSGQEIALELEDLRLEHVVGGTDVAEALQRLPEQLAGLVELAAPGLEAAEIGGGDGDADGEVGPAPDPQHVVEELFGLVEMALVGEDLGDVVGGGGGPHDVADQVTGITAPGVEVDRLVPPTVVLGVDPEVVQDVGLAEQVADLLGQGQRLVEVGRRLG